MNRRGFITGLAAIAAGSAVAELIPGNRVYSFPSQIVIPERIPGYFPYHLPTCTVAYYRMKFIEHLKSGVPAFAADKTLFEFVRTERLPAEPYIPQLTEYWFDEDGT